MQTQEIAQQQEAQLTKLRYTQDIREVMASKPGMEQAPEGAKGLALNIQDGEQFGKWEWLNSKVAPETHVYFEPVFRVMQEA